ncbi:hypothetical protein [Seonamhaeicola aphaedonensis]|uniref:BetR domain-containing protein n=1 Tax=Seonamhaeicola aphaedonensis TaxID=1461338 RepID=A0A3D9HLG6_9FLAO|nr:hypothetical protein [Seonamhaeicola aphaedonensis]RED50161.1 hypothetical protein DFQ02_101184 [Seonamhaeicola aphaedonensis]
MQEQFITLLKSKTSDSTSFVEEIASVLDIGYDAAYRRINLKTNLSLEEGVILARHFKVSLNKLFEIGNQNTIVVELPPEPKNEVALEHWLKVSLQNVQVLSKLKGAEIFYSAKDIPLFHTLNDSLLTRYKMYVWLKDLNIDMAKSQISFDEWMKTIPNSLLESAFALGSIYKNISITELWNDNTVTGTLQQILYYFEAGLVSKDVALKICDDVHEVINDTEKQTIEQSIGTPNNKKFFHLYKCDLHMLNNTIMVRTPHQKVFYSPFTVLSYFKIEHQDTCEMMNDFLNKQMSNSKLLATSGERDRTLFFKMIHQKISIAKERINLDYKMAFL